MHDPDSHGVLMPPLKIGIYAKPGFALLSYAALVDTMRAANHLHDRQCFEIVHFGTGDGGSVSSSGARLDGVPVARMTSDLDIAFVVAGSNVTGPDAPELTAFLRLLDRRGVTLGGVSGGPVILARAGLMKQRRMTVHWDHFNDLRETDPELLLERALYVVDRGRMTCAGGSAPVDMMHGIIAARWGAELARRVGDWFLQADIRPPQGPQRAGRSARYGIANATVLTAVELMENHLSDPMSSGQLAAITGVSPRQLSRLFRAHFGRSPMQFHTQLRLELARDLLRKSSLSLTEIALATGFGGSAHFATRFRAHSGTAPSMFRAGCRTGASARWH